MRNSNVFLHMLLAQDKGSDITVKMFFEKQNYLQQPFCYFPKGGRSCLNNPALKILQTFQGTLSFFLHPKKERRDCIYAVQTDLNTSEATEWLCTKNWRAESTTCESTPDYEGCSNIHSAFKDSISGSSGFPQPDKIVLPHSLLKAIFVCLMLIMNGRLPVRPDHTASP